MSQKKALLIGICNSPTADYQELESSHDDVSAMRDMLLDMWGYTGSQITVLVDDNIEGHVQPTRVNILRAIADFVKDVKEGDDLFFHYAGHSTQVENPRSNSEEDGLDECLVPIDGQNIVDRELYACLVKPLPAGSRLVAILDTSHAGTLLELKHYRCNRVYVPWVWRGYRNSDDIRNNIRRRGAHMMTSSQTPDPVSRTPTEISPLSPPRTSTFSLSPTTILTPSPCITPPPPHARRGVTCDPPVAYPPSSRTLFPPPPVPKVSRLSGSVAKGLLARIRARSRVYSTPRGEAANGPPTRSSNSFPSVSNESPKEGDNWILPARSDSPIGLFLCNGWCRDGDSHSTMINEDEEVKADVISLGSCRDSQLAWEGKGGLSVSSIQVTGHSGR